VGRKERFDDQKRGERQEDMYDLFVKEKEKIPHRGGEDMEKRKLRHFGSSEKRRHGEASPSAKKDASIDAREKMPISDIQRKSRSI